MRNIGEWKKGEPCYKESNNLSELYSSVLWKVNVVSNEIGCLAEISKQIIEGVAWCLLTAYHKI